MRADVDVLAMSATPIPRTLEMAVTGIREMSTIQTPPEERHPVLTYVGAYEDRQVAAAIRRELLREGQVFYLHNRVESIDKAAAAAEGARSRGAHRRRARADGRDGARADHRRLLGARVRRAGVHDDRRERPRHREREHARSSSAPTGSACRSCTSCADASVVVVSARTRTSSIRPDMPLSETAHDRLSTIAQNTDLGAGMAVAMKDLEIRGAGNLLGGEQSGHIAGVGFDLYVRMVGEAVAEFRRGPDAAPEVEPVRVELPDRRAHPARATCRRSGCASRPTSRSRRSPPRTTSRPSVPSSLDRYGPLPEPVERLLDVAALRLLASQAGVTEIQAAGAHDPVRSGGAARVARRCGCSGCTREPW